MSQDLVTFLRARLDEEADLARRCDGDGCGEWTSHGHTVDFCQGELSGFHPTIALHIALHNPARVLREVEAKRTARQGRAGDPDQRLSAMSPVAARLVGSTQEGGRLHGEPEFPGWWFPHDTPFLLPGAELEEEGGGIPAVTSLNRVGNRATPYSHASTVLGEFPASGIWARTSREPYEGRAKVVILRGPVPRDVGTQYAELTGGFPGPDLPPWWA